MTDEQIFNQAIRMDASERAGFLSEACKDDIEQRERVEALIAAHDASDSLLDTEAMLDSEETTVERQAPRTLGDFEILRELGRGGMGVVYEARQKSLNRKVALKVLSSGLGLSSRAIMRFRREAEAAGKLHHTNIVPIYTTGEERGVHFYAMELIDGPSLDRVIRELRNDEPRTDTEGRVGSASNDVPSWLRETALYSESHPRTGASDSKSDSAPGSTIASGTGYFDTVATMIADVADALDHAHEHGVIHRDVKPSNLLLAPDGRLSINDFGLARMLEQPGMTMTGEFVGSPLYMSPEQITAGRAPLDHRTDIYSLGATLYELLTLQPPFPGESRDQVIAKVLHKDPVSPRKLNRKVPVDLDTICMKAIEKDPDRRYQTAGQLADDLRRYVNRHAISARRIGAIGKVMKWTRRNPGYAIAISAVLLACCVTLGVLRSNAQAEQKRKLDDIQDEIYASLLRADFPSADKFLAKGSSFGASEDWKHFSGGLISLFRSEYGAAKNSLSLVSEGQNSIAAQGLLAVAHMWSGDEKAYFEQLRMLDAEAASDFTDLLCVGYAHCWGDPQTAVDLLNRANAIERNHSFVRIFRAQASRLSAMELIDQKKAMALIEDALADINSQKELIRDVPLVATETTLANLAATNIYARLGMTSISQEHRLAAAKMEPILEEIEDRSKVQYVLVLLLSHSDPRRVLELDERWRNKALDVEPHACVWMGFNLLQCREYQKALYWLGRSRDTPSDDVWKFVDRYVLLASNTVSLRELREQAEEDLIQLAEDKISLFDVTQIQLFGGDESTRKFVRISTIHKNYPCADMLYRYFGVPPRSRTTSAPDFLEKCARTQRPAFCRMHTNFVLGIEALAAGNYSSAKESLEACRDDNGFQWGVYRLSQALLEHEDQWKDWVRRRTESLETSP